MDRRAVLARAAGAALLLSVVCVAGGTWWPPAEGEVAMSGKTTAAGVRHTLLADLGPEHLANAAYRRGIAGDHIAAWGNRVLEWPLEGTPALREVVPQQGNLEYSNGGCALDVDGDGIDEIVVARGEGPEGANADLLWLREVRGRQTWEEHLITHIGAARWVVPHDVQPFAMALAEGRRVKGVVLVLGRRQLVWFGIPKDPTQPWERHEIANLPAESQSGMAVGNLAGHGRPDVACGMYWAECPADPTREPWTVRRYGDWEDGGWGGMAQLAVGDLDGDGEVEIVASEAEIPNAKLAVFKRDAAKPDGLWQCHMVDTGLYCPHSLALADLGEDGRLDIVAGEMTAGGWDFPMNPQPRILAYRNAGGLRFERSTLATGWGVHEMVAAPGRRDGKVLLFGTDEIQRHKFPDMKTHVSAWLIDPR